MCPAVLTLSLKALDCSSSEMFLILPMASICRGHRNQLTHSKIVQGQFLQWKKVKPLAEKKVSRRGSPGYETKVGVEGKLQNGLLE